jgi:DNA/RNA endonuclease YhcR with UshA esterase domain
MKVKAAPRETSGSWDEGVFSSLSESWQGFPPKYRAVSQPPPKVTSDQVSSPGGHPGGHEKWLERQGQLDEPTMIEPRPHVRKHRFHPRPQLIGTILLVIVAFSAGLAIGPYVTPYRSTQNMVPMTLTVMTTVETALTTVETTLITSAGTSYQTTSATVLQTLTTTTGPLPKWISSSTNVVSYLQAANYVGQSKIVEGKIVRTYASGKGTVFLDFHDPYQGYFEVTIFASDVKNFPFSPVSFYLNKEVRVTGTIEMYQGAPEIIVHSPSQIEVANMGFNYP